MKEDDERRVGSNFEPHSFSNHLKKNLVSKNIRSPVKVIEHVWQTAQNQRASFR